MRDDMARVIADRSGKRARSPDKPKGYGRRQGDYGEDGPPRREAMKDRWRHAHNSPNRHVAPLRRYLDAQVGRPWDKVFSEVCSGRGSAAPDGVRAYVEGAVARHVVLISGVPCHEGGYWHGRPLAEARTRWYVCPRTGLLRRLKRASRKRRGKKSPAKAAPPAYISVSDTSQCRFHDGAWHLVTLESLPAPALRARSLATDAVLKSPVAEITPEEALRHYGAAVYAVSCRRLARRELGHYPIPSHLWDGV